MDEEGARLGEEGRAADDDDYLSGAEIGKIECFYSSMGCYVYVGRCIAELYEIKRSDEDELFGTDPVDEYREFMRARQERNHMMMRRNMGSQQPADTVTTKVNKLFMMNQENVASDGDGGGGEGGDGGETTSELDGDNSTTNNQNKSGAVNYMYINSGVPVIVFNYGANPKRNKVCIFLQLLSE